MTVLAIAMLVALVGQAAGLLVTIAGRRAFPKLGAGSTGGEANGSPLVSVVVPARDEERNVERCLRSVLRQDYESFEVVAVDDRSTDATPRILDELARGDARLRVVHGAEPPPGWAGKPHAITQGVDRVRGSLLLLLDADVELHPSCLRLAVAHVEREHADLLTLLPRLTTIGFWERLVQPVVAQLVLLRYRPDEVNDPERTDAVIGTGPFMLLRRSAYDAVGGHAAVRADVVDDLALARLVKRGGWRLSYVDGTALVRLRMYRTLGEIWSGWSKNFYAGVGRAAPLALLGAAATVAVFVLPWLAAPPAVAALAAGASEAALPAASAVATVLVGLEWRRQLASHHHLDASLSWLQALGFLVVAGILVNSMRLALRGRPAYWKGRAVGSER